MTCRVWERPAGKEGSKMEELKNENVTEQPVVEETVVEQRPSTKYGRTAYQQQLQEEQAARGQSEPVQNQTQQNGYQYQQYTPYQEVLPQVKNWPAYVAMVLVAIMGVLSIVGTVMGLEVYGQATSIDEMYALLGAVMETPGYEVLAFFTNVVSYATIALLILDIIQLYKAGKKIGGAIAFAILLRPAYFIWRAHLLGTKKTLPIIFAVCVYLLAFVDYGIAFAEAFEMIMRFM